MFDYLRARDPSGRSWLPTLLRLPERQGGRIEVDAGGELVEVHWHPIEKKLPAPRSLLRYLVEHPEALARTGLATSSDTARLGREALLANDPATKSEGLAALETYKGGKAWYVFEGETSVDAYLETDQLVVVIEGKRTEPAPTTKTTWMAVRHQMLRNLDAAGELEKRVVGFFIVEGRDPDRRIIPDEWHEFARLTTSSRALDGSLPHRTRNERHEIAASFLGVTTWAAVCDGLSVPLEVLPG